MHTAHTYTSKCTVCLVPKYKIGQKVIFLEQRWEERPPGDWVDLPIKWVEVIAPICKIYTKPEIQYSYINSDGWAQTSTKEKNVFPCPEQLICA